MTRNQIEYQKLKEQQRSNQAQESIAQYKESKAVDLRSQELSESRRHNEVVESQAMINLGIQSRNAESGYRQSEASLRQAEAALRNAETNVRNAETNERNAAANWYNANTNRINATTRQYEAESGRISANAAASQAASAAMNAQTNRYNWMLGKQELYEARRSHLVNEGLTRQRVDLEAQSTAAEVALNAARAEDVSSQTKYRDEVQTKLGNQDYALGTIRLINDVINTAFNVKTKIFGKD